MSYGKVIAYGVALVALAWLDSVAGEQKRNWEEKYQEYQDDLDAFNENIEDKIQSANEDIIFEEYIQLHFQSFSVANEKKLLLDDARDSIKAIYQTLGTLKQNREDINKQLSTEMDKFKIIDLKKELKSVSETRKTLFNDVDLLKEQRNSLQTTLKKFNMNTRELKFVIRDYGGDRGENWYEKLEDRKAQRNSTYVNASKNEGGCFLSTACIHHMNLNDDCFELETLRYFRDTFVVSLDNGSALIAEYYENAPKILFEISKYENKDWVLNNIYQSVIKIVDSIEIGDNYRALNGYKEMYQKLHNKFLGY